MKRLWMRLLGIGAGVYAGLCVGGNSELMAENADRLLRLSNEIAERALSREGEGRYRFSARVVGEGATRRVRVERARRLGAATGRSVAHPVVFAPAALDLEGGYQSLISVGTIPAPVIGMGSMQDPWRGPSVIQAGKEAGAAREQDLEMPILAPGGGRWLESW